MKKVIKFPLLLRDEKSVRTLEELQEYFDMEKILEYYHNGKLFLWLEQRGLEREARMMLDISPAYPDYLHQICDVFKVEYDNQYRKLYETEKKERDQKRLNWLSQYTNQKDQLEKAQYLIYCDQDRMVYFNWDGRSVELRSFSDGKVFSLLKDICSLAYIPSDQQSICFLTSKDHKAEIVSVNLLTGTVKECHIQSENGLELPMYREHFGKEDGKFLLKYQTEDELTADYHTAYFK